jgi:3'-phosphoadenosine 5'-phosphosulfate (PAPS) 3'-phosphatase
MSFFSPLGLDQSSEPFVADSLSKGTIYVDPLDGTREFVDGRYENVTCLIGIAIDGKPVGGVIGVPFASFSHSSMNSHCEVHVVYGLVGFGIGYFTGTYDQGRKTISLHTQTGQPGVPPVLSCSPKLPNSSAHAVCVDSSTVVFMTGDSFAESPMLSSVLSVGRDILAEEGIDSIQHTVIGGAGKKMLLCSYASCDSLAVPKFSFKKQSTYLWDTCAPEAILRAVGGKVTDIFGSPLEYSGRRGSQYNSKGNSLRNSSGVIASSLHAQRYHNSICQKM